MKNLIILILISAFIIFSCSKDSLPKELQTGPSFYVMEIDPSDKGYYKTNEPVQKISYQLKDDRIVLQNSEDFKLFMWGLESRNLNDWRASISHQSYSLKELDIECPEFAAALNKDGLIQIGPYILKVDFEHEKVYVIDSQNEKLIEELIQTSSGTSEIMAFSFEDDVWDLLENQPQEEAWMPNKKCNEKRALNSKAINQGPGCTGTLYWWHQATFTIKYRRFGIWETCRAGILNHSYNVYAQSNNHYTDMYITGGVIDYYLVERCGPVSQGSITFSDQTTKSYNVIIRSDKKPLSRGKSTVDMEVLFNYLCAPGDPPIYHSVTLSNF